MGRATYTPPQPNLVASTSAASGPIGLARPHRRLDDEEDWRLRRLGGLESELLGATRTVLLASQSVTITAPVSTAWTVAGRGVRAHAGSRSAAATWVAMWSRISDPIDLVQEPPGEHRIIPDCAEVTNLGVVP